MNNILKTIILACLLSIPAVAAEQNLTILSIAESSDGKWIMVDRSWRKDCPKRIEVKLKVTEDIGRMQAALARGPFGGSNRGGRR